MGSITKKITILQIDGISEELTNHIKGCADLGISGLEFNITYDAADVFKELIPTESDDRSILYRDPEELEMMREELFAIVKDHYDEMARPDDEVLYIQLD